MNAFTVFFAGILSEAEATAISARQKNFSGTKAAFPPQFSFRYDWTALIAGYQNPQGSRGERS